MGFFSADLHVHTCLSPCAELEMLPELIIQRGRELGLQIIGITDHNSAENVAAVVNAAHNSGITVLPGIEVQTREEVHMITLFDTLEQVRAWQEQIYDALPPVKNRERVFGEQLLLDGEGGPAGQLERLLITSTSYSVEEVVGRVAKLEGLCIPAHICRPVFSILATLGFIPESLALDGLEISQNTGPVAFRERFPELVGYSLVAGSDAHRLRDMCRRTTLSMKAPTIREIELALRCDGSRGVWVDGHATGKQR